MALYEHLLIARQDISAQQVDALATHLKTIVEGEGGKIEKQEYWGLRGLAYRIKKNRKGHYVMFHIDAPHAAVAEMERNMRLNEDVLRYITIRIDAIPEGLSAMMQAKSDRGDRGDRGGFRRDRDDRGPRDRDDRGPRDRDDRGPRDRDDRGPRRERPTDAAPAGDGDA